MSEIRQRWRLVVARTNAARDMAHRDVQAAWETALDGTSLPFAGNERTSRKSRIGFAAPVPVGMTAERELLDLSLAERRTRADVRQVLEPVMPMGHVLVDLFDVWVGEPSLAGQVVAGDYSAAIDPVNETRYQTAEALHRALAESAAAVLAAPSIERLREKGAGRLAVDVRPQILALGVEREPPPDCPVMVQMRLRLGSDHGVGRPEEVIEILGERIGAPLGAVIVRQRVVLGSDT